MRLFNLFIFYITIIICVSSHVFAEHKRIKRLMYAMCPPNFIGIGSLCYYISNYQTSWLEAQFECKDKNSKLAEPIKLSDRKLRRYLLEHDKNHSDIWIGGTFDWQTKKWTWGYSGKDIIYNSFSQLDLGSSQDVHYHCAVLDSNMKYKWSARSCVDQYRFICQHKMPKVSDKNRMKIYTRWNETYPNQLANEVVIELSGDDIQRMSRVVRGHNSSTYYYVDCKIRRFDSSYAQRRRRMPPHSSNSDSTLTPAIIVSPHSKKTPEPINNINIEFEAHNINSASGPIVHIGYHKNFTTNRNEMKNNNENHFNYKIQSPIDHQQQNVMNETSTPSKPVEQRTKFDLEIEKKRLKARKRRLERKKARKIQKERKAEQKRLQEELNDKRKANLIELEALRKETDEQEKERRQNEIDKNRIQEITQQQTRDLEEKEKRQKEIEHHQKITEERKRNQMEHEQQLIEKSRQHEEWRMKLKANNDDDEQEMRDEEDRKKLIKQQEEEYKKFQKDREAEEKKRLDEELARLENERKLREQRQKERNEEIKRRQELIKKQEEEERLLQEDIKKREEEIRKSREEEKQRREEEQRKKELEELRKKIEKEEKLRQKQFKIQRAQEEKKKEIRERLSKLSPEEQISFFKRRQERKKKKRLANQYENEVVSIPE